MAIRVENVVKAYEKNGTEVRTPERPEFKIHSHWNRNEFVVVEMPDGEQYAVLAADLKYAIENATNWR